MNTNPKQKCRIEEISQMLIGGMLDLIGKDETQLVLERADVSFEITNTGDIYLKQPVSYAVFQCLKKELVALLGENGTRGAALRVGRSFFDDFFKTYGIQIGLNSLDYRMMPLKKRIKSGLETLSTQFADFGIKVSDDENKWYWIYEELPTCFDLNEEYAPIGDFSVGLLQAYLSWASGGKIYPVQQMPGGDRYVIEIGKKALG
jgi:hypothetical protein